MVHDAAVVLQSDGLHATQSGLHTHEFGYMLVSMGVWMPAGRLVLQVVALCVQCVYGSSCCCHATLVTTHEM